MKTTKGFKEVQEKIAPGRQSERVARWEQLSGSVTEERADGKRKDGKRKRQTEKRKPAEVVADVAALIRGADGESLEELGGRLLDWYQENKID